MLSCLSFFCASFFLALSGAMMPGPLLAVTIDESSRRGFRVGPLLIAGHAMLELALVIALTLGLAPFLRRESLLITIGLAGGAILLWMAVGMLRALPTLNLPLNGGDPRALQGRLVLSGIVLSLANPYWTIWWVTIGLKFIGDAVQAGLVAVAFFYAGHILADLGWYSLVSLSVDRGRRLISDRLYRRVIAACAVMLLLFGGLFIYSSIRLML